MINSLPNDTILDWFKLKTFTQANSYEAQMITYVFDRVENIVGKGENVGYQDFLLCIQ